MKVSRSMRLAFVSLSLLSVACDNGTPMFTEAVVGNNPNDTGSGVESDAPGQDAVAERPSEESGGEPIPIDDSTPLDRGEEYPAGRPTTALTSWTFQASTLENGSLVYRPSAKLSSQNLVMDNNVMATEKTFTQIDRPIITELYTQGSELKKKSEIFQQNGTAKGALDLLLVIDNSGSMKEEQENLSSKLAPLLSYVSESDWRIGVVTTDPSDGCLRGLIKKSDATASQAFATAVQPGIKGSGNERGILQAVNGLKGECNSAGSWLRNQSTVAVLIVSDEDNCSAGADCGNDPWASASYLTDYLSSIRQPGINARVYGLIGHPSLSSNQCKTMAAKAHIYSSVIDTTLGSWGSVCAADYSGTLQAISKDISVILMTQFTLQYPPLLASVKVFLDGVLQKSGYQVHGNLVEFASAPKAGSSVSFEYEFHAEAPRAEFALRHPAVASSIKVYLDGLETKAFSYLASSSSIQFASPPKAKEIRAVYRRGDELPKTFQMDKAQILAQMKVSVAGQVLSANAYSYNAETGILTLNQAPQDKVLIVAQANKILSHALDYALQIGETDRTAWDHLSGKAVSAQFKRAMVSFPAQEFAPGRQVLIKGKSPATWLVPLSSSVLGESLSVSAGASVCKSFTLENSVLNLESCGFAAGVEVTIGFAYEKERRDLFDLTMLEDINLEKAIWTVKVNGIPSQNYQILGGQLHMSKLPMKALIEVTMEGSAIM